MELLIVVLAVGASAYFIARRFWMTFTRSPENGCSEGCAGCSCTSGQPAKMSGNECILPDQKPANGSKPDKCATACRE